MPKTSFRTSPIAGAIVAACALAAPAGAVITANPMARPSNSFVGRWNGSSAVAIGPNWIVTARHNGGNLNSKFRYGNVNYSVDAIYNHHAADIAVIRLQGSLPGWHDITPVAAGQLIAVGGMGRIAGDTLRDGFHWAGPNAETWGQNRVDWAVGDFIAFDWDLSGGSAGSMAGAVMHEAGFAMNDSGGGVFVLRSDGSLALAGLAVGVSELNVTRHGSWSYALNLNGYLNWMRNVVGVPFTTPPAPIGQPIPAPGAAALFLSAAACTLRRRR